MPKKATTSDDNRNFTVEDGVQLYKGRVIRDMKMVKIPVACFLLQMSRWTLWREINLGRIKRNNHNLIPIEEIDRYRHSTLVTV